MKIPIFRLNMLELIPGMNSFLFKAWRENKLNLVLKFSSKVTSLSKSVDFLGIQLPRHLNFLLFASFQFAKKVNIPGESVPYLWSDPKKNHYE